MSAPSRVLRLDGPTSLTAALMLQRRGPADPTHRRNGPLWFRTTRTPAGPALIELLLAGDVVSARAWGAGAEWALDQLPRLAGAGDATAQDFRPRPEHAPLMAAHRRWPEFRVGATDAAFEALAPACIEQVVTGKEAFRAWRLLVTQFGELAPGPARDPDSPAYGMRIPPTPEVWARVPSWTFLAAGVEQRRSRTLVRSAQRGTAVERTLRQSSEQADRALRSIPGIGPWTSAEVRQRAHGDADAWSLGDYHVGKHITYALTGKQLDDDACLDLIEPYRGHRFRVQALLMMSVPGPPRRGPRMALPTHTPYATHGRS